MQFLYEATDASGKTILGKMSGASIAEVEASLLRQGYEPSAIAPAQTTGANVGTAITAQDAPVPARVLGGAAARTPSRMGASQVANMAQSAPSIVSDAPTGLLAGQTAPPRTSHVASVASVQSAVPALQTMPTNLQTATPGNVQIQHDGTLAVNGAGTRTGGIIMAGNAARVATQSRTVTQTGSLTQTGSGLKSGALYRPPSVTTIPVNASKLGGVKTRDLMFFFRQLGQLVHSGMSVYAALDNLAGRTRNENLAKTAKAMADSARTGGKVSDVMANYPRIYPEHVVGLVRAGETGGFLEIALTEIADVYDANIKLYRTAWIPKLMATQAFFMFAVAQPLFPTLFPNFELKLYLALVLLRNLPITFALYFLIKIASRYLQLPQYRYLRDDWSLRLPPFGTLQRLTALTNFMRVLRRLYAAGLAPGAAWEGAMYTASNVVIRDRLATAYAQMQSGATLAQAFQTTGLFQDNVEQMILTGQQSGTVVESLEQVGNYYQMQAEEATGKARFMMLRLGILAMLILGGGTVIWMAKTYFKSIFDFADSFAPKD